MALEKKVGCGTGLTWLILLRARPSRPDEAVSFWKEDDTCVADSTAWFCTVTPPMLTTSVKTSPDELLPSPYLMLQVAPCSRRAVELAAMLNTF